MLWMPLLLLFPLLTAIAVIAAPAARARTIALVGSLVTFIWSIFAAMLFDWSGAGVDESLAANIPWLPRLGTTLNMGADSVSMLLVLLTTFLLPLCVLGSFSAVQDRLKEYYGWMLGIEAAMIGVFIARDLIFFYVCFEFTLVPMYFLIAIYGGAGRAAAATKFFLYTFTGSLLTLAGLLFVAWKYSITSGGTWTFDIATLTLFAQSSLTPSQQGWILLALLAGFAVKVPLFPVHTWLPLAHTEAPTAGSVILAGVLLKLGTYGLYRFVLPIVPDAVIEYAPAIAQLSIIGILYAALICWVQRDVKKLIAYSSVSHLGFCVLGLFALNPLGVQGSVLYMINHGLSTGALFFCVGMMYERYHTREMDQISGLARVMPVWGFFMVFFTLASVGLPGLNGFVSEFLCLIATFTATADNAGGYPGVLGPWYAAFAGVGMIFAAMYLLIMLGKIVFGPVKEPGTLAGHGHGHDDIHAAPKAQHKAQPHSALPKDLGVREIGVLVPIAILCVVLGLYPKPVTDAIEGPIEVTLAPYQERSGEADVLTNAMNAGPLSDAQRRIEEATRD
ncbi:MAG: complex I subunit 4 family protein [Phycisphaerales bacterium]